MKQPSTVSLVLALIFVGVGVNAQKKDDFSRRIDSLLQTTDVSKFSGVVLITQNGNVKYAKASGYADYEKKTPISLKDNFRIQSKTKQIMAVLVLKEVEKGSLNLDVLIRKYLKLDVIILENVYNDNFNAIYHFERELRKIVMSSSLVKVQL